MVFLNFADQLALTEEEWEILFNSYINNHQEKRNHLGLNLHSDHQWWGAVLLCPLLDFNTSLAAFIAYWPAVGVDKLYKIPSSVTEKTLTSIYLDPSQPASFGGLDAVYRAVKERGKNKISRKQVREWLSQQDVYTLHKPAQRRYKRSWVIVPGIDAQFQVDLVNLQNLSRYNKVYKYLLTGIDIFSKYAFVWRQYKVKNWSKPFKRSFLLVANLPNCNRSRNKVPEWCVPEISAWQQHWLFYCSLWAQSLSGWAF